MAEEALALHKEMGVLIERFVNSQGVSKQTIDEKQKEIFEKWYTTDSE